MRELRIDKRIRHMGERGEAKSLSWGPGSEASPEGEH
jgi:hypothetical protein